MTILRSLLFDILFYAVTLLACIVLLPTLLMPRMAGVSVARFWTRCVYFLEKNILGLDYEIRGREHVPGSGSFIVAAKHQSAYETMKLHALFDDPTIVLKQELTRIPLWGAFLKKVGVIAIDRSSPDAALASIISGARSMMQQGRPIIIFPQGTRVPIGVTPEQKRYKNGVAKVYEATGLPIIPLALNSGVFWPKTGIIKHPGKVVFEFLPPILPGQDKESVMAELTQQIEERSDHLTREAQATYPALVSKKIEAS